jgi:glycosidase
MVLDVTSVPVRLRISTLLVALPMVLMGPRFAAAEICPVEYQAGQLDHWANGAVIYQVFVRSFQDSDGDGIGDFNGLTAKLDYLNDGDPSTDSDLGVDAIWMLPITESPSYHGYDTLNYERVERDYGTEEDFDRLLEEAHRRGIKVIMDLVLNHSSVWHPWFVQASQSVDDTYHDWYVWREEDPGWTQPWSSSGTWHLSQRLGLHYYGLFWGGMPDLNFENPDVRAEMIGVAKRWLDRGVDGFRLDASRYMIEGGVEVDAADSDATHDWWEEFAREVRRAHPDTFLVGENWTTVENVAPYYGDAPFTELDMNFNFDLAAAIVGGVRDDTSGLVQMTLCDVADFYPPHALDGIFLTNHDMVRVATQVGSPEKARFAASLLFTLPGVPLVYYGEEVGLVNGPGDEDPEKRTPMPWTDEGGFTTGTPWKINRRAEPKDNVARQQADPDSLWHHYRRLIALRKDSQAIGRGGYRPLDVEAGDGDVIAWERTHGEERVIVLANFSTGAAEALEIEVGDRASGAERLLGEAEAVVDDAGVLRVGTLGAHQVAAYRLD